MNCEDDDMQIEAELLHFGIINLRKECLFSIGQSHRAQRNLLHSGGRREVPDFRLEC